MTDAAYANYPFRLPPLPFTYDALDLDRAADDSDPERPEPLERTELTALSWAPAGNRALPPVSLLIARAGLSSGRGNRMTRRRQARESWRRDDPSNAPYVPACSAGPRLASSASIAVWPRGGGPRRSPGGQFMIFCPESHDGSALQSPPIVAHIPDH